MKAGLRAFSRGSRLVLCPAMVEADLVGAAGVVSVVRTVTSEEFGPGAVADSDAVDSDDGVELLKAVSLSVSALEAQERFGVGRAMLREIDAGEFSGPLLTMNLEADAERIGMQTLQVIDRA